jgi:hypothetical protein
MQGHQVAVWTFQEKLGSKNLIKEDQGSKLN